MLIDISFCVSIDVAIGMSIDSNIIRAGRMWVFCCELLVSHDPHGIARCGLFRRCCRSMSRTGCSWLGVDRHQCDPPKLIRLSTSKSPSCRFSSFTTCKKSSPMMAFTWCFITSSSTPLVKSPCLLTASPLYTTCISSYFT